MMRDAELHWDGFWCLKPWLDLLWIKLNVGQWIPLCYLCEAWWWCNSPQPLEQLSIKPASMYSKCQTIPLINQWKKIFATLWPNVNNLSLAWRLMTVSSVSCPCCWSSHHIFFNSNCYVILKILWIIIFLIKSSCCKSNTVIWVFCGVEM